MPQGAMKKFAGRKAELIYQDSKGVLSYRRVTVFSERNGKVRVWDWEKRSFRTLACERILSALPFVGRVG